MDSKGIHIRRSAFYFFERLPTELAGGRKPHVLIEKGIPTLYRYRVRFDAEFDFFHAAVDAGYHFFKN